MHTIRTFSELSLDARLRQAVTEQGYDTPTPIQTQAIPILLEGRDLLGVAQTGTGKTAAFALPILERLARNPRRADGPRGPRVLVLAPTRELALQVCESFTTYGRHLRVRCAAIFGGVGQQPQVDALRAGAEVVVATPGRLLDLMDQGYVRWNALEVLVLDEADRMLDMGFIKPIRQILATLPKDRQTMLFSATMPPDIAALAGSILNNPEKVSVAPVSTPAERVAQSVAFVTKDDKRSLLSHVLDDPAWKRVVVFTRTKHGANRVAQHLVRTGVVAEAIHGNKSQSARQRALSGFKTGSVRVLVATDIAARGLDIDDITHVINFDLPNEPETYVHRIGRTGRAGASGSALSFCDGEERAFLRDIERLTRSKIPVLEAHPYLRPGAGPVRDAPEPRPSRPMRDGGSPRPAAGPPRHGFGGGGGGGGGGGRYGREPRARTRF